MRKAQKAGFVAQYWENPPLETVYEFIGAARRRKGFPLTLPKAHFLQMFQSFPDHYHVFAVHDEAHLAALTVAVKIDAQVLYNFYPADAEEYLAYSPTVLLSAYIVDWAKEKGFSVLDLGIATEEGIPNIGLMRFKKNLGAIESVKYTITIPLSP